MFLPAKPNLQVDRRSHAQPLLGRDAYGSSMYVVVNNCEELWTGRGWVSKGASGTQLADRVHFFKDRHDAERVALALAAAVFGTSGVVVDFSRLEARSCCDSN